MFSFSVVVRETDLYIRASKDLSAVARASVIRCRNIIEAYIKESPAFAISLKPVKIEQGAPPIIREMADAANVFNVGPMASVAGAISHFVSQELLQYSPQVIVENGGDIYISSLEDRVIGIYAGNSPLSGEIGLTIKAADTPMAICTSSGTVGHSLSFGKADAVVTVSKSAAFADAAATAIGNIIKTPEDIQKGIELAAVDEDLNGVVIIVGDKIGVYGNIEICRTDSHAILDTDSDTSL